MQLSQIEFNQSYLCPLDLTETMTWKRFLSKEKVFAFSQLDYSVLEGKVEVGGVKITDVLEMAKKCSYFSFDILFDRTWYALLPLLQVVDN